MNTAVTVVAAVSVKASSARASPVAVFTGVVTRCPPPVKVTSPAMRGSTVVTNSAGARRSTWSGAVRVLEVGRPTISTDFIVAAPPLIGAVADERGLQ